MTEPKHETHEKKVIEEAFVDRNKKSRVRQKAVYVRTLEQQREMELLRLGPYGKIKPSTEPMVATLCQNRFISDEREDPNEVRQLIFEVENEAIAHAIISHCLRKDRSVHRVMTGTDILAAYVGGIDEGNSNRDFLEGYPITRQMYVMFGYIEASNRYLPQLLVQLLGQRKACNRHIWLFLRENLEFTCQRWGEEMRRLAKYKRLRVESSGIKPIETFLDQVPKADQPATTKEALPPSATQITPPSQPLSQDQPREISRDRKFTERGDKKKKRY